MPDEVTRLDLPAAPSARRTVTAPGWAAAIVAAFTCNSLLAAEYTSSVIASNLNNPRGLAFAPDGSLYIAEAGIPGGTGPSTDIRGVPNVYTETGSITRYFGGTQARLLTGLPSIYNTENSETIGPSAVTFGTNGTLYATIGSGVDPTVRSTDLAPNGNRLGRIEFLGGSYDVSQHEALQNPAGGPLDSNPWATVAHAGGLLVTDAGANALLNVSPNGTISTVATFPPRNIGGPMDSDAVPTGLAIGPDGNYYVGQLTGFPFTPGEARVYQVTPDGTTTVFEGGFTQITSLAFGTDGSLYVLEFDANGILNPGDAGALTRITPDGQRTVIFSDGLVNPTGLAIGSDGALYVSNFGNSAGDGEVLRIAVVPEPQTYALLLAGLVTVGVAARTRTRRRSIPV